MEVCKAPECGKPTCRNSRDYCNAHYLQVYRHGRIGLIVNPPTDTERLTVSTAYQAGQSTYSIGRMLGWQDGKVGFWLKRWGIALRTPGFQKRSVPKRKKRDLRRWIEHDGIRDTLAGWARRVGITPGCLAARIRVGWALDRALAKQTEPPTIYESFGPLVSREEARSLGLTRYRNGKKCRNGHLAERFVSGSQCVICVDESNARRDPAQKAAAQTAWRLANPDRVLAKSRAYRLANQETVRSYQKQYHAENREEINRSQAAYVAHKRRTDIQFKLVDRLRHRLRHAIKRGQKGGSAVRDLGCSIPFFVKYIESQFTAGMTWANWGRGIAKWHLDHKRALSTFDLTDRAQFLIACHYTNLQPLWAKANIAKGKRRVDPQPLKRRSKNVRITQPSAQGELIILF